MKEGKMEADNEQTNEEQTNVEFSTGTSSDFTDRLFVVLSSMYFT
jgi:hypothetical protein